MSSEALLEALRIDAGDRDDHDGGGRRMRWLLLCLLVAMALPLGWLWWSSARALEVQTVTASLPARGDSSAAVLQATGYVTARRQATVSAQIVGTLTEVLIEEGDFVEQGQVLARLDDSSQQAALNSARAGVEQAAAQLNQLDVRLQQARRDQRRQEELVARELASSQSVEVARTEVESLTAQQAAARASLGVARAQVALAGVNYGYTVVRAPFDGVITQKAAQVGEIIAPSAAGGGFTRTGVGTIVDMGSLEVEVDVNEAYIGRVKAQMPAQAVLDAYPDWTIPAHVIAIVPTADRGKATIKVRVALEETDERVVPDMGVRVTFMESRPESSDKPPSGVLVPASAIVTRDGERVVFVVEDHTARAVRVAPAAEAYGDLKLLPGGVAAGQKVINRPAAGLDDGARVKPAGR